MRAVSIIVLAWNRWPLTRRLLESIQRFTDLANVRVIVVDNGSIDETASELAKLPWLRVLRHEKNLGFVRGNNAALLQTGDDDVVLQRHRDPPRRVAGGIAAERVCRS